VKSEPDNLGLDEYFSIGELACRTRISETTLRRELAGFPGVIEIAGEKSNYRQIRVPMSAFKAWLEKVQSIKKEEEL
jgi:hypothetical protein